MMNPRFGKTFAAALLALAGTALADHPRYRVTVLPALPDGLRWSPTAINDNGDIVGAASTSGFPTYGYATVRLLKGGEPEQLPNPAGNAYSAPVDILEDGTVIGNAAPTLTDEWKSVGWFYRDGAYDFVPEFVPGRGTHLAGINAAGVAIANANDGSFTGVEAFIATGDSLSMLLEDEPGYHEAAAINDAGQIAGTGAIGLFRLNPDGTYILVPPLETYPYRTVTAMNDLGHIAGILDRPQMQGWLAFLWTEQDGYTIIVAPGLRDTPVSLDNHGNVFGNSADNTGRGSFGWIWSAQDGLVALDDLLVPEDDHFQILGVRGINALGQVIAGGFDVATETDVSLLLTPVSTCTADFNRDAGLSPADFTAFREAYLAGDLSADVSGDGSLGLDDFTAFRALYLTGCP